MTMVSLGLIGGGVLIIALIVLVAAILNRR